MEPVIRKPSSYVDVLSTLRSQKVCSWYLRRFLAHRCGKKVPCQRRDRRLWIHLFDNAGSAFVKEPNHVCRQRTDGNHLHMATLKIARQDARGRWLGLDIMGSIDVRVLVLPNRRLSLFVHGREAWIVLGFGRAKDDCSEGWSCRLRGKRERPREPIVQARTKGGRPRRDVRAEIAICIVRFDWSVHYDTVLVDSTSRLAVELRSYSVPRHVRGTGTGTASYAVCR